MSLTYIGRRVPLFKSNRMLLVDCSWAKFKEICHREAWVNIINSFHFCPGKRKKESVLETHPHSHRRGCPETWKHLAIHLQCKHRQLHFPLLDPEMKVFLVI